MPMVVWKSPGGSSPSGTAIEVRVRDRIYTMVDGQPIFVDPADVTAVTSKLNTLIPGGTVTTPAAAQ